MRTDDDITEPEWLADRESPLACRDEARTEQYDLLEVDPDSGAITPVLDDQFLDFKARQHPTDPNRIAFASNRGDHWTRTRSISTPERSPSAPKLPNRS